MKREQIIRAIKEVLSEHGIREAYLFGSFARKERYRDIDIAIEPPKGKFSLLDLVGVEQELEDETGKNVDVVILRSIKPRLKPYIKKTLLLYLKKIEGDYFSSIIKPVDFCATGFGTFGYGTMALLPYGTMEWCSKWRN